MDKRRGLLNVWVSVVFKLIIVALSVLVRRVLIQSCGNEINGLNALFLGIVGFLAVAELGVGSAITYCMYKPIVEGDSETVSALYHLFRKLYVIVGAVILLLGLVITPFIHHFAKDYTQLDVDLYGTFLLMLASVVLTYGFSAKTSLMNAYKCNYITTTITSGGMVLQLVFQIVTLLITRSFVWYLVCRIVAVLLQWIATEIITLKKYAPVMKRRAELSTETIATVKKNTGAMFMHKIGNLLVNTVDSITISTFIGVVALGYYSNYITILNAVSGILVLVFSSLTSVVGHLYVKESASATQAHYEHMHKLNFVIGVVFFLGYYAIVDDLVAILFGADLLIDGSITFAIALNGFIQFMRQSTLLFRDATGTFYYDRWKPAVEGVLNLSISLLLVQWIGVAGVVVATIITNLTICHIVEPYVLYKNAFHASVKKLFVRNYTMITVFAVALVCMHSLSVNNKNTWIDLLLNGMISVGISCCICGITIIKDKAFKGFIKDLVK